MRLRLLFGGLSSVLTLPVVIAACSSTTNPVANVADSGAGNEAGEPGNDAASAAPDAGEDVASVNPDAECAAEPSFGACGDCCSAKHEMGYVTLLQAMIACVCKGAGTDAGVGPCAQDCADSFCKATPSQPTGACDACLQAKVGTGGVCAAPVMANCNEDSNCVAYDACTIPCKAKP